MNRQKEIGLLALLVVILGILLIPVTVSAQNSVTITHPNGGDYERSTLSIAWTVTTNDSLNDSLSVGYYNTSCAIVWLNTSLPNTSTSYSWNTAGVTDNTTFWVIVFKNSTNSTVVNVSDVSNAVFTVDNTNPTVFITGSSAGLGTDDHIYTFASALDFSGNCSDATAGVKNVSVAGTAGTVSGSSWTVSSASVSTDCNVVTATVYDNCDNTATDTVTVCRSATKTGSSYVPPTGGEAAAPSITEKIKAIKPLSVLPSGGEITQKLSGLTGIGVIALILLALIIVLLREKKK